MTTVAANKRIKEDHRIICSFGNDTLFGYFGWPSACRIGEHELLAAASGFRTGHVDPFGKSVCFSSSDDGLTWGAPQIVNDSPVDDRDTGLTALNDGSALLTWFASDTRGVLNDRSKAHLKTRRYRMDFRPIVEAWDDSTVAANVGAFTRIRSSCGAWSARHPSPVSAPHGPVLRRDGTLLYLGNECRHEHGNCGGLKMGNIIAVESRNAGESWTMLGSVPDPDEGKFYEAHVVELPDGELLGALRHEPGFSIYLTRSTDGGKTWTKPEFLVAGAPPSLLRHSSGTIVMSYSWRGEDPGQRVAFSLDGGRTWSSDWILRDDGPDSDLGYPSTVELADGSLCTVYYQKVNPGDLNCALMASHWTMPQLTKTP
jgi:hypothetical protein